MSAYDVTTDAGRVVGARCDRCPATTAPATHRCALCGAVMQPAAFEPTGSVFSATRVWIPVGGAEPPSILAYVDLDDGPRLLARWSGPPPDVGARARVRVEDGLVEAEERG